MYLEEFAMTLENSNRPWGSYSVLHHDRKSKVKIITVQPSQSLSLQYHNKRSEHWFIVSGVGIFHLDGKDYSASPGDSFDIPLRGQHTISNTGKEPLVFIEVQTGEEFNEDDIVRISDIYGRA